MSNLPTISSAFFESLPWLSLGWILFVWVFRNIFPKSFWWTVGMVSLALVGILWVRFENFEWSESAAIWILIFVFLEVFAAVLAVVFFVDLSFWAKNRMSAELDTLKKCVLGIAVVPALIGMGILGYGIIKASDIVLIGGDYAKNSTTVYYWRFSIPNISPNDFIFLWKNYAKDGKNVFWRGRTLTGADPSSFSYVWDAYAKDSSRVYYWNQEIIGADPSSFSYVWDAYAKDSSRVYYISKPIENADPASFKSLGDDWAKDMHWIYHYGELKR